MADIFPLNYRKSHKNTRKLLRNSKKNREKRTSNLILEIISNILLTYVGACEKFNVRVHAGAQQAIIERVRFGGFFLVRGIRICETEFYTYQFFLRWVGRGEMGGGRLLTSPTRGTRQVRIPIEARNFERDIKIKIIIT